MKLRIFFLAMLSANTALAGGHTKPRQSSYSTHVAGYTKADGTRVRSANRSRSDRSTINNYSTKGNINPYTTKSGKKNVVGH